MTFAGAATDLHDYVPGFPITPSIDAETSDGNFYGTVFLPFFRFSPSSNNRIFRMTPAGVVTDVHVFTGGDDGETGFVRFQGADGNLYGTTATGSTARIGAIFRLTPDGTFSILHAFAGGATDGAAPGTLIEATDGNFYGITIRGGPANLGTVFKLTPGGAFALLHTFDGGEGSPQSFLQGLDGNLPPITGSAPTAPTGLTAATPPVGLPRVSLTWTASSGATSYTVKRGIAPGTETTIAVGVKFSHWTDAVNVSGARYYYVVSAVNGAGASANSNEVSARVPARVSDFSGDGATDLLVYRPSAGAWYDRDTGLVTTLGQNGDVPLPGDYDGDGINDVAVFRPSTATWIILASSTGRLRTVPFGIAGDVPVPGDYDGDGTVDLAVYRPSTGLWFIQQSSTDTMVTRALGVGGDIPVPSDYDGDHIVDVAVYRPASGMWYIRQSSTGGTTSLAFQWGLAGDVPVPGDYDGDGLSDVAVFRPSAGQWYVRQSATATLAMRAIGTGTDLTVPADYNGDGRVDLAVYRPSTGRWYAMDLTTGLAMQPYDTQWGLPGDIPPVNVAIRNAMTAIAGLPAVSSVANLMRGGDFDADGRGDLSVYRPSTGAWFTLLSQTGYTAFTATAFGTSRDTPVPLHAVNRRVEHRALGRRCGCVSMGSRRRRAGARRLRRRRPCGPCGLPAGERRVVYPAVEHQLHHVVVRPVGVERRRPRARRLRRRWPDGPCRLPAGEWRVVHPEVEQRVHDVRRVSMGLERGRPRAGRVRRRRQDRSRGLPAGERHVVHPEIEQQFHGVRRVSVGPERRHSRPERLRRRRQNRCRRLPAVERLVVSAEIVHRLHDVVGLSVGSARRRSDIQAALTLCVSAAPRICRYQPLARIQRWQPRARTKRWSRPDSARNFASAGLTCLPNA